MRSIAFASRSVTAAGGAGDMPGLSLPFGEARGIIIDNPSGSWLRVSTLADLVPPYTYQWSRDMPYSVASVDVRYVEGPIGQLSTQDGSPFTVWLDSDAVGASNGLTQPGVTIIEGSVEPEAVITQATQCIESAATVIVPVAAVATRRVRIYEISFSYAEDFGTDEPMDGTVKAFPNGTGAGPIFAVGVISPSHPVERMIFDPPHNLDVGEGLQIDFYASWVDTYVDSTVRYRYV